MSTIASHTELNVGLGTGGVGLPLISVLGPDSWLYALNGHTPDFPRTLTVTRTRAKPNSNKYGWKFVVSVLEADDAGDPLPQPHVAYFDLRPTKGGASADIAIHALLHIIYTIATQAIFGLSEYAATNVPGSMTEEVLTKGYALPDGNFMPSKLV